MRSRMVAPMCLKVPAPVWACSSAGQFVEVAHVSGDVEYVATVPLEPRVVPRELLG